MDESSLAKAKVGDLVAVHPHHVGEPERFGEILDVLGAPDRVHFRVRWDDDHESIYYPGNDARVHVRRRRSTKTTRVKP